MSFHKFCLHVHMHETTFERNDSHMVSNWKPKCESQKGPLLFQYRKSYHEIEILLE